METTLLILANSVRKAPNRCIAGREAAVDPASGRWQIGRWMRVVSRHGGGEVPPEESVCEDGLQPAVFDLAYIPLAERAETPCQPENFFYATGKRWKRVGKINKHLHALAEEPPGLWDEPGEKTHRASGEYLDTLQDVRSLCMIRPEGLSFRIWQEPDPAADHPHRRRRALFRYNGVQYRLPVTDPSMDPRYFMPYPRVGEGQKTIRPKAPDGCLLVVSLGARYTDGFHYKIVATVIEEKA